MVRSVALRDVLSSQLVHRYRAGPRIAIDLHAAALAPDEQVTCGKLPRFAEDRIRRRDRVEGQERLERVEIDRAPWERAQLGRELECGARVSVVERLDPIAVARQQETPSIG